MFKHIDSGDTSEPHSVCPFYDINQKKEEERNRKKIATPAGIISRHEFLARCHDLLFFLNGCSFFSGKSLMSKYLDILNRQIHFPTGSG